MRRERFFGGSWISFIGAHISRSRHVGAGQSHLREHIVRGARRLRLLASHLLLIQLMVTSRYECVDDHGVNRPGRSKDVWSTAEDVRPGVMAICCVEQAQAYRIRSACRCLWNWSFSRSGQLGIVSGGYIVSDGYRVRSPSLYCWVVRARSRV